MVRLLARLLGLLIGASIVAAVAGAVAAVNLKKKAPPRPDVTADEIDLVVVMDGARFASTAPAFRGGRVICWYAGLDVDLRDATLDPAGATLKVRTAFGGTRVVVAPGVPVRVSGPAIFGGRLNATDTPEPSAEAPGLTIMGFTVFGGLQVVAFERGAEIPAWTGEREHPREHGDGDEDGEAPTLDVTPEAAPA